MIHMPKQTGIALLVFFLFIPLLIRAEDRDPVSGCWVVVPQASAEIDLYGTMRIDIETLGDELVLDYVWGGRRNFRETLRLKRNGAATEVLISDRVFPTNVFMGLSMPVGEKRIFRVTGSGEKGLQFEETFPLLASQGRVAVTCRHSFSPGPGPDLLTYTLKRSSREEPLTYILKREGSRVGYFMRLQDNWDITDRLNENVFLISLQGLANRKSPSLYFIYPKGWDFTYTPHVFDYYRDKKFYTFRQLNSLEQALEALSDSVKGYVVWDRKVRTSLIVAFTVAGLEDAVVVDESLIPLVETQGLKPVEDFRGRFEGWTDAKIYSWARDRYWARCSRDFLIWL